MDLRARIKHEALRCATATTMEQLEDILSELVSDVIHDDAQIARNRALDACAMAIDKRAVQLVT